MLAVSMSPPIAQCPTVQKRPKLSLNTSELPITYGSSSRNLLTIATPTAAVTPTTINTFNNTYDLTHRPSPTSSTASPSLLRSTSGRGRLSRSQSPRPKKNEAVYTINLPYGVKPILRNTPYPRVRTNSISASPRSSTRRVFFPAPKQVVFKNTIEEEVVTRVYTARHSDLFQQQEQEDNDVCEDVAEQSADVDSKISVSSEQSEEGSSISVSESSITKRPKSRTDIHESIRLSTSLSENEPNTVATPSATRKRRQWEWTLAPIATGTHPESKTERPLTPTSLSSSLSSSSSVSGAESADSSSSASPPNSRSDSASPSAKSPCQAPSLNLSTPKHRANQTQPPRHPTFRISKPTLHSTSHISDPSSQEPTIPTLKSAKAYSKPGTQPPSASALTHLSPPPQPHPTKRAGSLDDLSRKRKAECLDISTVPDVHDSQDYSSSDAEDTGVTGRTGLKRRERAATL